MTFKPTVLIVDDDVNILSGLTLALRKHYHVLTTTKPMEAISMVNDNLDIAVVISDYLMPGMTGLDIFMSLQNNKFPLKIMLSGLEDFRVAVDAINVGKVDYFLCKPIDTHELQYILDNSICANDLPETDSQRAADSLIADFGMSSREAATSCGFRRSQCLCTKGTY